MKKFEFELQSLLNLSRQKERLIELTEQQVRAQLEETREQIEQLRTRLVNAASEFGQTIGSGTSVGGFLAQRDFELATTNQITATQAQIDELIQVLDQVVQERLEQRQESESLETLRDERLRTWRQDRAKAEQAELVESLVRPSAFSSEAD